MRILYIDQTGQLGGGELSLLDVIKHLQHPCEVVLFSDGPFRRALNDLGVKVHLLEAGGLESIRREGGMRAISSQLPSFFRMRKRLKAIARDFDILYANSQKAFIIAAVSRKSSQRLIWHLRDLLIPEHFNWVMRKAAVFAANFRASTVIANSNATKEAFIAQGGRAAKVEVVYNGLSGASFDAVCEDDVHKVRTELGLEGKFLIGTFGRLTPWKGQHIVIDALASNPDVYALIVGDAIFGEEDYADQLRLLARTRGVEHRTRFLGFRRDIPILMKSVDVVVHSSVAAEPFGRVIVEGMLAEKPVIATRAGGALEIVRDGITGLLVEPGSAHELSDAIVAFHKNRDFALQVAKRAKDEAGKLFSIHAMIKTLNRILSTSALGQNSPKSPD